MRERDIERYLIARVKALGGEVRKVKWIGRRSAPDRLVLLPGRCYWVEIKAPGKTPTPAQKREHARLRNAGADVFVLDSHHAIDNLLR